MDLFDFGNPISHNVDPSTSSEAAQVVTGSGARSRHAVLVLDLVERFAGLTAIELWESASLTEQTELKEPQEVRRRLTDLQRKGLVLAGPARLCRVRGTKQVTWTASDPS